MKKIGTFAVALLIVGASVFGIGNQEQFEFDPTPTKFEGEWRNSNEKYNDQVYVFTGNRWKFTSNDESWRGSGYFTFTNDAITLYKEDGKKWWWYGRNKNPKYKITGAFLKIDLNDKDWVGFLKQHVEEFVTSGEMFDKIQGTWRASTKGYTYIFSGNNFSFFDSDNKYNREGTFALTNNGLLQLLTKEGTGFLFYSFLTDESIRIDILSTPFTAYFGTFNKQ
jgi:hypothetical protein